MNLSKKFRGRRGSLQTAPESLTPNPQPLIPDLPA